MRSAHTRSNGTAGFYSFALLFLCSWTRGLACDGKGGNAADNSRIGVNRTDFGEATTVPFLSTEPCVKKTLHAIPGNRNTCRSPPETQDVHVVILHALAS